MGLFKTMTHTLGDKAKDAIRKGVKTIYEHAVDEELIERELDTTTDPLVSLLHDIVNDVIENTERRPHARNWRQVGRFGLWVTLDDPAHRHQVLWALNQIVNERHEEFQSALEQVNIPEPDMWYVNCYQRGEEETSRLEEESDASRTSAVGLEAPFYMGEKGRELMMETDEDNLPF